MMTGAYVMYFAYGATMGRDSLKSLCPGAEWLGVARLEGHDLCIAKHGGVDVMPSADSVVLGALWMLPAPTLEALEDHHGVGAGLTRRITSRVVTPGGPRAEAMMYVAPATPSEPGSPDRGQWDALLAAGVEIGLPAWYIEQMSSLAGSGRNEAGLLDEKTS